MHPKSLQSCLTLCDPMERSPLGSSVHGILQARILEWVSIPFSRISSPPRDQTCISYISCTGRWVLYHPCHLGTHPLNQNKRDHGVRDPGVRDHGVSDFYRLAQGSADHFTLRFLHCTRIFPIFSS